ncbi:bifunctional Delta(1)-pyrroline-2-carboxylate/Delta(1)-piperideine-2-carboxylate reductase [Robbsia sp. KACC 23696]|uniref:bifunctional Delta(1)-pyrroline-2-carboxylate/Delta(1)-piperideine-2- carboxylate reductase n=1 Tax=Robbsia sp. KACC 23696 TaxID=3149231 RepID=UPI00325B72F5
MTFDAEMTASLLDYPSLVESLRQTVLDYGAGKIISPERLSVPLQSGVMLSMPSSAEDIAIHKLVSVCPGNAALGLPTINGQVIACNADTGEMLFVLDGPTVTGRRTAAVSALGAVTLLNASPRQILVIGTGTQASNHVEAFATLFPDAQILARGVTDDDTKKFVAMKRPNVPNLNGLHGEIPDSVDVVVTVTTSKKPVYDERVRMSRLVIGVGAFTPDAVEISKRVVDQSFVVLDDPVGAKHEAGDLIQASFDWTRAATLAQALQGKIKPDAPIFLKSVGCAAWDLAACRVARKVLG